MQEGDLTAPFPLSFVCLAKDYFTVRRSVLRRSSQRLRPRSCSVKFYERHR